MDTSEQTMRRDTGDIQILLDIIQKMSNKIDNLENKIDHLIGMRPHHHQSSSENSAIMMVPDYTPSINFQKWIQNFDINKDDVMNVLETNILDGFKDCIIKNMSCDTSKPICAFTYGRHQQIYIYDIFQSSIFQWHVITDDDIYLLIDIIWRKMLEYYFVTEEELMEDALSDNEQIQRDLNKKVLLDMKIRLHKHIKEIKRCILETS